MTTDSSSLWDPDLWRPESPEPLDVTGARHPILPRSGGRADRLEGP